MVIFNPQVTPLNPPDWTNAVGSPISGVEADKSKAIAIGTATQGLDSAVGIADNTVKSAIREDVREGVDKLRDAYTDSLKTIRNMQIATTGSTGSLLPPEEGADGGGDAPAGLQNGIARVKQLGVAVAQNGSKINDTLYTGALNAEAKRLRNQYPGYRDYIDEQIKSVSGVDPANAFMRNLMEDINRNAESNKTEMNATRSMLRDAVKTGFHDANGVSAAQMYEGFDKGIFTVDQVNKWYNGAMKLKFDIQQKADARAERNLDDQDQAKSAIRAAGDIGTKVINQGWDTFTIGKGTDTFAKMAKFIQDNAGNQNVKDERSQMIGQQMVALRNAMYRSAWTEATNAGLLSRGGENAEAVRKALDNRFATLDLAIDQIYKKEWGAAYSHMNFNKAITEDSTNLLYNAPDEDVRRYNRMVGAVNSISPQAAGTFFKDNLLSGVPKAEKEFLKTLKMELLTQPDVNSGKISSAQGAINQMKAKGATSPKTYTDFIDTVNLISDPKWDVSQRINLARGFFDPKENAGLLSDKNFQKDFIDQNGKQVPGKYSVFYKLSSPTVANSIKELGAKNPSVAKDYEVMMTREFGEQLFSRELRDLANENQNASTNRGYQIGYVDQKGQVPRFVITDNSGKELTDTEALVLRAPVAAKNRLNGGIGGLYNVYTAANSSNPNADIMKTMGTYGFTSAGTPRDISQGWTGEVSDLPRMFWNSLIASQQDRLRKAGEAMRNK